MGLREQFCKEYYDKNKNFLPEWQKGIELRSYWKEYACWLEAKLQNELPNSDDAKLPEFEAVYKKAYQLDGDKMTVATFYECLKDLGNFA